MVHAPINSSAVGMLEVKYAFFPMASLAVLIPSHSPRIEKPSEPPASCQSHMSLLFQLLASCEVQVSAEQYKGSTNTQLNLYLFRDSPLVLSLL